jgi:hypothetical protein
MSKMPEKKRHGEAKEVAARQHQAVCAFLNHPLVRPKLPSQDYDAEFLLLRLMLESSHPLTYEKNLRYHFGSYQLLSAASQRLISYLDNFSKQFSLLTAKEVVITLPRTVGGHQLGRYFKCRCVSPAFPVDEDPDLDGPATQDLLREVLQELEDATRKNDFGAVGRRFRQQLEASALRHLAQRLHDPKCEDCQNLELEVGLVQKPAEMRVYRFSGFVRRHQYDHNRSWSDFCPTELHDPHGPYILSSDMGTGKTVFLRRLQLTLLQQNKLIPVFLHACNLETAAFRDKDTFIACLPGLIRTETTEAIAEDFFREHYEEIVFLVDGLDQIRGSGTAYRDLLGRLLHGGGQRLIIAARPFAVISHEHDDRINFLRLKPFSETVQRNYFGSHFDRACQMCVSCPELMSVPMLANMVRTVIQSGQDVGIKTRTELYGRFVNHILAPYLGYDHENIVSDRDIARGVRQALAKISYSALAEDGPSLQKIPMVMAAACAESEHTTVEQILKHGPMTTIIDGAPGSDEYLYFSHQSFQEYLAAEWVARDETRVELLLRKLWNPKWEEVIRFLAGLVGEPLIHAIYSPGCNDNCIHSRLFLAANCCHELGHQSQIGREILPKLVELTSEAAFCRSSLLAMCDLYEPEAVDFLVDVVLAKTGQKAGSRARRIKCDVHSILDRIAPKLQAKHADHLAHEVMADPHNTPFSDMEITDLLANGVSSSQLTRIIDAACNGQLDHPKLVASLLSVARSASTEHVSRVFGYIGKEDGAVRLAALRILRELAYELAVRPAMFWAGLFLSRFHIVLPTPRRELIEAVSSEHFNMLGLCLGEGVSILKREAVTTLGYIACLRPLPRALIRTFILSVVELGGEVPTIPLYDFRQPLSPFHPRNVQHVRDYMADRHLNVRAAALRVASQVSHIVPAQEVQKAGALLDSSDPHIRMAAASVLRMAETQLPNTEIDRLVRLLDFSEDNTRELWQEVFFTGMFALSAHTHEIQPEHIDLILDHLDALSPGVEYRPVVQYGIDHVKWAPEPPLPANKLTASQIDRVASWLSCPIVFKRGLAIQLLTKCDKQLPRSYLRSIWQLLPSSESPIIVAVMEGLAKRHHTLTSSELAAVISCLRRDHNVRWAALTYLRTISGQLTTSQVDVLSVALQRRYLSRAERTFIVDTNMAGQVARLFRARIASLPNMEYDIRNWNALLDQMSATGYELGPTETKHVMRALEHGTPQSCGLALDVLSKLPAAVDRDMIHRVILCMAQFDADAMERLSAFLNKYDHVLPAEDVGSIVRFYLSHVPLENLDSVIRAIPSPQMAEHMTRIADLLDSDNNDVKVSALGVLSHFCGHLTQDDLAKITSLLHHPDGAVHASAYGVLTEACGLGHLKT